MSDAKKKARRWLALSMAAAAALIGSTPAPAATWLWDPQHLSAASSGTGSWTDVTNAGTATFFNGTADAAWDNTQFLTADFGGAAGTFTVTIDPTHGITAGGLQFDTAGYTLTGGTLTLNESAPGAATITTNANATISSTIAGGANLTQVIFAGGSGKVLTLTGASTYSVGTTLTSGVLRAQSNTALGTGTALTIGGGELQLATSFSSTFAYNTQITGNAQITSDALSTGSGAGNTYTLNSLNIGAQTLTIAGGVNVLFGTAGVTVTGTTTLTGAATFTVNDGTPGTTTLLTLAAVNTGGNSITFNGSGNTTVTGVIGSGAGGLTYAGFSGSGLLTLTNANTYTGTTTVNSGELDLNSAIGPQTIDSSNVVVNGGILRLLNHPNQIVSTASLFVSGTFDIGANNQTLAGVTLAGGAITGTTGILTSTGPYNVQSGSISAILAGSVAMNQTTSGTVTLSGANTFNGGLTINGGNVIGTENSGTPFGPGSISLNLGTLGVAPTAVAALTAANAATSSTLTFSVGEISLTKTGGVLSFTVGNSGAVANSVLVRNGLGTLEIAPGNGTAATNLGINEKLIINGGLGTLTNAMVNPYIVGENNDTRGTGDFLTYGVNGFTIATYTDTNFTAPTNAKIETVTAAKALAVTDSVYAMRTAAGATITLNTGGAINIGNGTGFAGLILNNSDILTGVNQTGTSIGFGAAEGDIYASGNGDLISAPISGSGGITEFGGTTLFLAGTNTFTGALTLSGGHVGIIAGPALGASTNTVALNAGTLSLDEAALVNQGITVSSLGGSLDVAFGKTAGYYGSGFALSGAAPMTTALTKINPGSLNISSPNAFAGNLVLATNGGTVRLIGDIGTLASPTGGSFTNLAGLTINPAATFLIDNQNNFGAFTGFVSLAAAANPNRLNAGAAITLNGGTFSYTAANSATAGAIQEGVGPVTLLTGASTITATASGQGAEINIPNLIRNNNTTVNFNATGTPGATGNNGRIILNGLTNNGSGNQALPATGGMIGGWATVNTGDFASYTTYVPATTTGGIGVVTYNSTNTTAAFASGVNTNLSTPLQLSGAIVTGSLRLSGGTSGTNLVPDISFTNLSDTLNIETGGIVASNANVAHVIGGVVSNVSPAPTIPGFLTAGGTSGTGPVELFIHQNQSTMTINSLIVDNGNRPLTLIKDQGGAMTITGAYLDASSNQFNNTYSGGTVLINSGDVTAFPVSNVPGVLGTGAVTINNTRLIINSITSAVNPISNPNSWNISNNFTYTVSNSGSLQFSAVGFLPSDPNTNLNQQTIRVMGNSELAISIFATNGTPDTASSLFFSGAGSSPQDVKADPGSVIAETGAGALVDPVLGTPVTTNNGGASFFNMGLPTSPTYFFGMEGSFTTNLIVGAGTPWIGISTGRGNNYTYTGGTTGTANNTITYNSDFVLQSFLFNNTLRTLTLGNGAGATDVVRIVPAAGVTSANVQVNGNITLNNDQSIYQGITFVVTPGSTLLLNQNNSLGGSGTATASTTANVIVQAGGLLNLSGALTNPINGNVTLEPGATYLADDVTNVGGVLGQLNGAGVLTFQPGSYINLAGGGTNVGLVNALTGTQLPSIPSGVIIRLNTNTTAGVGLLSIGTFGLSSKIQPNQIFEAVSGGPNTITTATGGLSFASNPGGDNLNLSGAFLTSGITGGTISQGGGRIIVGAGGVTIAGGATVLPIGASNGSETFVLQEDFDLPAAGLTLTVGSTAVIDGLPKSGTYVNLSTQGSRSVVGGIIDVTNGSQLQLSTSYSTPFLSTLTVESGTSVLINSGSNTVGALTGPGTIVSNNAGLLQVGYGDQTSTFTGIFAATGTVGLPFDSVQPNLNKIGAGTLNLTGSSTGAGTLDVIGGTLDINGAAGSVKFATIDLNRGQLTVDYTVGTLIANRLGGVGTTSGPTLTFSGGDLTFLSGGTETLGTVNYNGGGISNVNLGTTAVTIVSNQARSISTIILHGTNVGGGALDGTLLANASQATGTYAAGQITTAIRPDILSDSTPTGTSANPAFTTYDPTNGYRAITAAETTPNIYAGQNVNNNVQLAASTATSLTFPVSGIPNQLPSFGTDTVLQSLTLSPGSSLTQANSLTATSGQAKLNINGGGILAQSGTASTITAPFITGANYIYNAGNLTLNATIVNGQQLVKAGPGTLTLGPGAINNADNNFAVNGGTLALGAGSSFLVTGTTTYGARSLFLSGGTLDLMGNSVIVGTILSTNVGSTVPAAGNGNITSTGAAADFATNSNTSFYGTLSNIGNLTHFSTNTTNFQNSISVSGNVTVRGGSMLLTNLGQITGVTSLVVNQGQFEIDNLDSLNFNLQYSGSNLVPVIANRIPAAAGVVLNGGQFTVLSSPGVIDAETFGTGANGFQIASGTNTIAGTAELNSSANITIGNLVRNAGSHAVVNFTGSNLGNTGELYQVTHFTISQLNGVAFDPTPTLTNNIIGPWAVINGADWATYSTASLTNAGITLNARGLSNLGNLNSGYANYAVSAGTTLQIFVNGGPNDNLNVGGSQENAGVLSHTIYTLKTSGSILLNAGETLTLAGGGILTNTNAGISLTTVGTGTTSSLTSTYKPAGAPTAELYAWINQNTTSIFNNIVDNGTSPVTLIKAGPATLTLSAANTYTGGTVVSQGTLTLGDLTADGATQFSIPAKGAGVTGADLTIIGATNSTTIVNYTPTYPTGQIAPTAVVELDGTASLQLNPNTGVTNTTTLGGLIFKNAGGGGTPTVQIGSGSGGGTLVLKGNITSTNDNYATVPSLTENLGTANTPLAVLDLNGATSTIDTEGLSFLGLNIQTGIQNGAILKIGPGTLGIGIVNANLLAGTNVGAGGNSISTLTGGITINAGTVRADSTGALGTNGTLAGTTITGGNTVTVNATSTLLAGVGGTLTGNIILNGGTLQANNASTPNFSGPLVINASSTIAEQDVFYTQAINRPITISGPIAVVGTPTLNITAAPYSGSTAFLTLSNNTNNFTGATINIGANAFVKAQSSTGFGSAIVGATIDLPGRLDVITDGATVATSNSTIPYGNNVTVTAPGQINVDRASTSTGNTIAFGNLTLGDDLTVSSGDSYVASFSGVTLTSGTNAAINNSANVNVGAVNGTPTSFTKYNTGTLNLTAAFNTTAPVTIARGIVHGGAGSSFSSGPLKIVYGGQLQNDPGVATTTLNYAPTSVSSEGLIDAKTGIMNFSGVYLASAGGVSSNQPFAPAAESFFTGLTNNAAADGDITLQNSSGTFLTATPFTTGTLNNQRLSLSDVQAATRARFVGATTGNLMGGLWETTFTVGNGAGQIPPGAISFGLTSDDGSNLYVAPLNGTIAATTFTAANLVILNDAGTVHNGHGSQTIINTTPSLAAGTYVLAVGWYNGSGGGAIEARYYPGVVGAGTASPLTNPTGGAAEPLNGFQPVPYANQLIIDPGNTPAGALEVDLGAQLTTGGFAAENVLLNGGTSTTPPILKIDTSVSSNPVSTAQIFFVNGSATNNTANLDIAPGRVLNVTQALGISSSVKLQTTNTGTLLINGANNVAGSTYTATAGTLAINTGVLGGSGTIPATSVTIAAGATVSAGASTLLSGAGVTNATGNLTTTGSQTWTGGAGSTGGTYAWKLNANNAGTPNSGILGNDDKTGANWDQLTMSSLTISASPTSQFNIEIISLTGTGSNPFQPTQPYSWTVANTTGNSISGFLASAFHFNTSNFIVNNPNDFSISTVTDGPELDLVISYTPTPEPTSFELLGVGMVGLLLRRRRGQKARQLT